MKTLDAKEFLEAIKVINQLSDFINAVSEKYPNEVLDIYLTGKDSVDCDFKYYECLSEERSFHYINHKRVPENSTIEANNYAWVIGDLTPEEKINYLNGLIWSNKTVD